MQIHLDAERETYIRDTGYTERHTQSHSQTEEGKKREARRGSVRGGRRETYPSCWHIIESKLPIHSNRLIIKVGPHMFVCLICGGSCGVIVMYVLLPWSWAVLWGS